MQQKDEDLADLFKKDIVPGFVNEFVMDCVTLRDIQQVFHPFHPFNLIVKHCFHKLRLQTAKEEDVEHNQEVEITDIDDINNKLNSILKEAYATIWQQGCKKFLIIEDTNTSAAADDNNNNNNKSTNNNGNIIKSNIQCLRNSTSFEHSLAKANDEQLRIHLETSCILNSKVLLMPSLILSDQIIASNRNDFVLQLLQVTLIQNKETVLEKRKKLQEAFFEERKLILAELQPIERNISLINAIINHWNNSSTASNDDFLDVVNSSLEPHDSTNNDDDATSNEETLKEKAKEEVEEKQEQQEEKGENGDEQKVEKTTDNTSASINKDDDDNNETEDRLTAVEVVVVDKKEPQKKKKPTHKKNKKNKTVGNSKAKKHDKHQHKHKHNERNEHNEHQHKDKTAQVKWHITTTLQLINYDTYCSACSTESLVAIIHKSMPTDKELTMAIMDMNYLTNRSAIDMLLSLTTSNIHNDSLRKEITEIKNNVAKNSAVIDSHLKFLFSTEKTRVPEVDINIRLASSKLIDYVMSYKKQLLTAINAAPSSQTDAIVLNSLQSSISSDVAFLKRILADWEGRANICRNQGKFLVSLQLYDHSTLQPLESTIDAVSAFVKEAMITRMATLLRRRAANQQRFLYILVHNKINLICAAQLASSTAKWSSEYFEHKITAQEKKRNNFEKLLKTTKNAKEKALLAEIIELQATVKKLDNYSALFDAVNKPKKTSKKSTQSKALFTIPKLTIPLSKIDRATLEQVVATIKSEAKSKLDTNKKKSKKKNKKSTTTSVMQVYEEMLAKWKSRKTVLKSNPKMVDVTIPKRTNVAVSTLSSCECKAITKLCKQFSTAKSLLQKRKSAYRKLTAANQPNYKLLRSLFEESKTTTTSFTTHDKLATYEVGKDNGTLYSDFEENPNQFSDHFQLVATQSLQGNEEMLLLSWRNYLSALLQFIASSKEDATKQAHCIKYLYAKKDATETVRYAKSASEQLAQIIADLENEHTETIQAINKNSIPTKTTIPKIYQPPNAKLSLSDFEIHSIANLSYAMHTHSTRVIGASEFPCSSNDMFVSDAQTTQLLLEMLQYSISNSSFNSTLNLCLKLDTLPFGFLEQALRLMRTFTFKSKHLQHLNTLVTQFESRWQLINESSFDPTTKPSKQTAKLAISDVGVLSATQNFVENLNCFHSLGILLPQSNTNEDCDANNNSNNANLHPTQQLITDSIQLIQKSNSILQTIANKIIEAGIYQSGDLLLALWSKRQQVMQGNAPPTSYRFLMSFTKYEHTAKIYRVTNSISLPTNNNNNDDNNIDNVDNSSAKTKQNDCMEEEIRLSHMFRKYYDSQMNLEDVICAEIYRFDVTALLTKDKKLLNKLQAHYSDNYKAEIQQLFHYFEGRVHSEHQKVLKQITNPFERVLNIGSAAVIPWKKYKRHAYDFHSFHDQMENPANKNIQMTCSEFAVKSTVAAIYDLDDYLCKTVLGESAADNNNDTNNNNTDDNNSSNTNNSSSKHNTSSNSSTLPVFIKIPFKKREKVQGMQPERLRHILLHCHSLKAISPPSFVSHLVSL